MDFPQFLATARTLPRDKLVKLYLKTREAKALAKRSFDEQAAQFDAIMDTCENTMLASCDATGDTGFTTPHGTTYTAETTKISLADDKAFFDFVKQKGDLDFFERRVATKHVQDYMKLNNGVAPPGLSIFRERVMRVRKASDKQVDAHEQLHQGTDNG